MAKLQVAGFTCVALRGKAPACRHALRELKHYLKKVAGVSPSNKGPAPPGPAGNPCLWVGREPWHASCARDAEPAFQTPDDFAISRVGAKGLLLIGASPRGLLYAVYHFLNKLGCHWPSCGEHWEILPARKVKSIPDPSTVQTPRFRVRGLMTAGQIDRCTPEATKHLIDWMARNRMSWMSVVRSVGDESYFFDRYLPFVARECERRDIELMINLHAIGEVPAVLFDQHPEMFAFMEEGAVTRPSARLQAKKVEGGWRCPTQLCLSNPETLDAFRKRLTVVAERLPRGVRHLAVCTGDGHGHCMCEGCRELKATDKQQVVFNTAQETLVDRRPDIQVHRMAYLGWYAPPEAVSWPAEKVTPLLFDTFVRTDEIPLQKPYSQSDQGWRPVDRRFGTVHEKLLHYMKVWTARGVPVIARDNAMRMYRRGTAAGIARVFEKDFKVYERIGLAGCFSQAYIQFWHGFAPTFYAAARLEWDGSDKADACIEEFCRLAFGPAAADISRYAKRLETITQRHTSGLPMVHQRFSGRDIQEMRDLFTNARRRLRGARRRARLRDLEEVFLLMCAWREEDLHARKAENDLIKGRYTAAASHFQQAADAALETATISRSIEQRTDMLMCRWADRHLARLPVYQARIAAIRRAFGYGNRPLERGSHVIDPLLIGCMHHGGSGLVLREGVRLCTHHELARKLNLTMGFTFRLSDPAEPCRVVLSGSNTVPAYEYQVKPRVHLTLNGKTLYRGGSRLPTLRLDPDFGAPLTGGGNWSLAVPSSILQKRNTFVMSLTETRAQHACNIESVRVVIG